MILVPLAAEPNQRLQIILGNQDVTLRVYTRAGRLYTDLDVAQSPVWDGVVGQDMEPLKRYPYLPFSGQLVFLDMQGNTDPQWAGLGSRYFLVYMTDEEAAQTLPGRNP